MQKIHISIFSTSWVKIFINFPVSLMVKKLEVSDCGILRYHDSRIMTHHDCENHHDCHILQTFDTN